MFAANKAVSAMLNILFPLFVLSLLTASIIITRLFSKARYTESLGLLREANLRSKRMEEIFDVILRLVKDTRASINQGRT
jgi:hypothetical protein